ncbi:MAG: hypothetical protein QXP70_04985, partial [Methanomassiliicoccales archaeon]
RAGAGERSMVLLNAAAALYVADKVRDMHEGIEVARNTIETGKAREAMENFLRLANGEKDGRT